MSDEAPGLDQLLCFSVYALGHAFNRIYKPLLGPIGLTYPQYLVMRCLWERDEQTVTELGRDLQLESSTLTPLLKRLEASNLLCRQRDDADERRVRIRLTAEGRALRARAAHVPACVGEAAGGERSELLLLTQRLHDLRRQLDEQGGDATPAIG
ncbi:MarR family winged helix-turn-helix transcriptional regulator [Rhizosaccharibacter radicis]|uniref:MarR family transcriptional regulator n=1 Tax=Rhizosaccharibacter radicis TaxID=2782605 RepID=A0ABT1VWK0_9PROT|nr:MarR family transcriptional regulator [Acetobacteraceae bacterium KSS12]